MRPVRSLLVVTAVALLLHLWMLAGHGQHALPSMPAGHQAGAMAQEQLTTTASAQHPPAGVGMEATCLAVLTALAAAPHLCLLCLLCLPMLLMPLICPSHALPSKR